MGSKLAAELYISPAMPNEEEEKEMSTKGKNGKKKQQILQGRGFKCLLFVAQHALKHHNHSSLTRILQRVDDLQQSGIGRCLQFGVGRDQAGHLQHAGGGVFVWAEEGK